MNREIPSLTRAQMREIDRIMIADFHIDLIQMMENAGRSLAELAIQRFHPESCAILAGTGGNGGGGLAAARHLGNRGVDVRVVLATPAARCAPAAAHQLDILERIGVAMGEVPSSTDLVVDALIGYSLRGSPRGRTAQLIRWTNLQPAPVLSLDTPSGLDVTTGAVSDPCVSASATLTLALPKRGLLHSASVVGELWLADISVPRLAYERIGITVPQLFADRSVIRLGGREPGGE